MATFAMQSLGCDVAPLNTVHFSELLALSYGEGAICVLNDIAGNHTGYKQFKGTRATAEDISQLYQGLCQSYLTDFDVMLSGYTPNAPAVEVVGNIGLDLQEKARERPGSFFWGTVFSPFLSGCLDGWILTHICSTGPRDG